MERKKKNTRYYQWWTSDITNDLKRTGLVSELPTLTDQQSFNLGAWTSPVPQQVYASNHCENGTVKRYLGVRFNEFIKSQEGQQTTIALPNDIGKFSLLKPSEMTSLVIGLTGILLKNGLNVNTDCKCFEENGFDLKKYDDELFQAITELSEFELKDIKEVTNNRNGNGNGISLTIEPSLLQNGQESIKNEINLESNILHLNRLSVMLRSQQTSKDLNNDILIKIGLIIPRIDFQFTIVYTPIPTTKRI